MNMVYSSFSLPLLLSNLCFQYAFNYLPIFIQPPEAPKETKEAEQTVAEVNTNGKQSDNTDVKKKPNKRERKKERQQKNGKSVKGANMAVVQESEEHLLGKKKKKGKKRQHSCEEDENDGQTGNETSSNKKKKSKAISINTMWNGFMFQSVELQCYFCHTVFVELAKHCLNIFISLCSFFFFYYVTK